MFAQTKERKNGLVATHFYGHDEEWQKIEYRLDGELVFYFTNTKMTNEGHLIEPTLWKLFDAEAYILFQEGVIHRNTKLFGMEHVC